MKTNLKIYNYEDNIAQTGKKYTRFQTSKGWMSCFDKDISDELKSLPEDRLVSVETQESKDKRFVNITKLYDTEFPVKEFPVKEFPVFAGTKRDFDSEVKQREELGEGMDAVDRKRLSVKDTKYEKDPVGLAVEVFNAIYADSGKVDARDTMTASISLVKQAQKAFE